VGRRPVGYTRGLPGGGYRLRFGRQGTARPSPKVHGSRAGAGVDEGYCDVVVRDGRRSSVEASQYRSSRPDVKGIQR
jgi:hypothetical protein